MERDKERPDADSEESGRRGPPSGSRTSSGRWSGSAAQGRPEGPGGYVETAVIMISAAAVVLGVALFLAGFWTHSLLDDDLDSVEEELAVLNERTGEIQESLSGAGGDDGGDAGNDGTTPSAATSEAAEDDPTWGPEDASVVIVEFADFQCPACGAFALQTQPSLREAYGDEVRYIFRDFPLTMHADAQKAAEAAQCAQEQGQFWEYHDLLFENQAALTVEDLKGYAQEVGVDTGEFNDCLDSGKNQGEVELDLQDGVTAGVTATPFFFLNGAPVRGALPLEQFQQVIDQLLAEE